MSAPTLDLQIDQGSTFVFHLEIRNGAGANPPVLDLTGYTAKAQMRASYGSTVLKELTTSDGTITIDAALGKITLTLSDEQTAAMTFNTAIYDLVMTGPTGVATRVVQGKVTVSPGVTL